MKRHETEPFAFGILAALFYLLFVTIACNACGAALPPTTKRPLETRGPATVEISVWCLYRTDTAGIILPAAGSGVVLGGRKVLTSNHVVACKGAADIQVLFQDGRRVRAVLERAWPERDIAKLVLEQDSGLPDVGIVSPRIDNEVCASSALPEREQKCGSVQVTLAKPICQKSTRNPDIEWCYDFVANLPLIPGNSGSGVYNTKGELVGIGNGGQSVVGMPLPFGYISSLAPIKKELLK